MSWGQWIWPAKPSVRLDVDADPEVTAVLELMVVDPDGWEFQDKCYLKYLADLVGIWMDDGWDSLRFDAYRDRDTITDAGKRRLWQGIKRLRAYQIMQLVDAIPMRDRCRAKVGLPEGS